MGLLMPAANHGQTQLQPLRVTGPGFPQVMYKVPLQLSLRLLFVTSLEALWVVGALCSINDITNSSRRLDCYMDQGSSCGCKIVGGYPG